MRRPTQRMQLHLHESRLDDAEREHFRQKAHPKVGDTYAVHKSFCMPQFKRPPRRDARLEVWTWFVEQQAVDVRRSKEGELPSDCVVCIVISKLERVKFRLHEHVVSRDSRQAQASSDDLFVEVPARGVQHAVLARAKRVCDVYVRDVPVAPERDGWYVALDGCFHFEARRRDGQERHGRARDT